MRLIAKGGRIELGEITEIGEPVFVPLERVRTHRNADKGGTFRWYNDYRLPERLGGGTVTVRLHTNDEDRQRKFNRAENVRQIPPGDPDFETLYKRRNDAESINRHLDDTLWLRRAHSVGARRQLLNLITYAMGVNALFDARPPPGPRPTARRLSADFSETEESWLRSVPNPVEHVNRPDQVSPRATEPLGSLPARLALCR